MEAFGGGGYGTNLSLSEGRIPTRKHKETKKEDRRRLNNSTEKASNKEESKRKKKDKTVPTFELSLSPRGPRRAAPEDSPHRRRTNNPQTSFPEIKPLRPAKQEEKKEKEDAALTARALTTATSHSNKWVPSSTPTCHSAARERYSRSFSFERGEMHSLVEDDKNKREEEKNKMCTRGIKKKNVSRAKSFDASGLAPIIKAAAASSPLKTSSSQHVKTRKNIDEVMQQLQRYREGTKHYAEFEQLTARYQAAFEELCAVGRRMAEVMTSIAEANEDSHDHTSLLLSMAATVDQLHSETSELKSAVSTNNFHQKMQLRQKEARIQQIEQEYTKRKHDEKQSVTSNANADSSSDHTSTKDLAEWKQSQLQQIARVEQERQRDLASFMSKALSSGSSFCTSSSKRILKKTEQWEEELQVHPSSSNSSGSDGTNESEGEHTQPRPQEERVSVQKIRRLAPEDRNYSFTTQKIATDLLSWCFDGTPSSPQNTTS